MFISSAEDEYWSAIDWANGGGEDVDWKHVDWAGLDWNSGVADDIYWGGCGVE